MKETESERKQRNPRESVSAENETHPVNVRGRE